MDAQALIDNYINDVGARLPRKLRNDVGFELRSLLTEQLQAAAQEAGRPPDHDMAIEVVRGFGRPEEVAARYRPRGFNLIEPEHAPVFVQVAAGCVALQWAITLPRVFLSSMTFGEWWLSWGYSALAWVGWLVVWFGAAAWIRRRSPVDPDSLSRPWTHWIFWLPLPRDWQPVDPEANFRRAATRALPLSAALTIFFIAPAGLLAHFLPAGTDTSWAQYGEAFRHWLLPPLIALMIVRLALFTAAVVKPRWWAPTAGIRFGLWLCFVGLLYWSVFRWDIFAAGGVDAVFKAWLLIFLLINTIQIVAWIYRALARVRMPKTLRARHGHRAD